MTGGLTIPIDHWSRTWRYWTSGEIPICLDHVGRFAAAQRWSSGHIGCRSHGAGQRTGTVQQHRHRHQCQLDRTADYHKTFRPRFRRPCCRRRRHRRPNANSYADMHRHRRRHSQRRMPARSLWWIGADGTARPRAPPCRSHDHSHWPGRGHDRH